MIALNPRAVAMMLLPDPLARYLDDTSRFATAKQLVAYEGVVPWVQISGDRERYGRITKRGPNEL